MAMVWKDLCRGPHLPNTRHIKAFKIERSAAATGVVPKNPTMQRLRHRNGPPRTSGLPDRLEEAAKRDHRKLAPRWTCSPSRMKLAPAWPCSTRGCRRDQRYGGLPP